MADRLGATVQANLLRAPADAGALTPTGVHVRLVKGAYVEPTGAHPTEKPRTSRFCGSASRLAESGASWSMASPDGRLREALLLAHGVLPVEQLFGVRPESLDELHARGVPTRVYVPTARTGTATGCAGSPSRAAPDDSAAPPLDFVHARLSGKS